MFKLTLWWELVQKCDVWIILHPAGANIILGFDLMIPAGIILDLLNATSLVFNEIPISLPKNLKWMTQVGAGTSQ